jgi:hypothetical protein
MHTSAKGEEMRNRFGFALFLVLLVLALPGLALAQAPSSSPADHIFVSGGVLAFNGPNGMTASSNLGAALQLTKGLSAGYNQVTIPSLNRTYRLGVLNYTRPLSSYLGKKLSSKFVFDVSQINVTLQAGGGKVAQVLPHPVFDVIAESAGAFISYPLANHVSAQVVGVQWLHGGKNPSHVVMSTGLNFHF